MCIRDRVEAENDYDGELRQLSIEAALAVDGKVWSEETVEAVSYTHLMCIRDSYEAAKIDGANAAQIFFKITLPYIMFIMGPYIITDVYKRQCYTP